jgi:hypothetical protein
MHHEDQQLLWDLLQGGEQGFLACLLGRRCWPWLIRCSQGGLRKARKNQSTNEAAKLQPLHRQNARPRQLRPHGHVRLRKVATNKFSQSYDDAGEGCSVMTRICRAFFVVVTVLLAGCDPPYLSDIHANSTPKPRSFDTSELVRMPVVVLAFVAPGNLQGFGPTLSLALDGALSEVVPRIRNIPVEESLNRLTDQGLATEYADLRAGFARNGMLDRQRLRRVGLGLGSRYVLLPGIAQFEEEILDKYEAAGIKLLRNRVTTLRLWLQLWDSRTGHMVWESSGEVTTTTVFLSPRHTVALEQIAKKLLVRMLQDGLLQSKTEIQLIQDH